MSALNITHCRNNSTKNTTNICFIINKHGQNSYENKSKHTSLSV
ncbi:hypothetical protein SAMN05421786_10476 [Chryseobacterium ureilyticum]|uniref:Uncharacterized protein n=1 Tax=Chryseobacterium ureilyticum TaxID=373668 RepID=A0A1N7NUP1_9FLAO|nr:hypothetical protein SAMN05421786_10476 [Chryseobacterium ureilyticum]